MADRHLHRPASGAEPGDKVFDGHIAGKRSVAFLW